MVKTKKKSKPKRKLQRVGSMARQPKSKKPTAVQALPELYKVELEVAHRKEDGTTEYTYAEHESRTGVTEETAIGIADSLKLIGCGGRIIHLDGNPGGKVINTWGSVERTAEAEKVERAALEKGAGQN